ncbi:hypothetical protein LXL04_019864 [Taraxacum kok-saghyz]
MYVLPSDLYHGELETLKGNSDRLERDERGISDGNKPSLENTLKVVADFLFPKNKPKRCLPTSNIRKSSVFSLFGSPHISSLSLLTTVSLRSPYTPRSITLLFTICCGSRYFSAAHERNPAVIRKTPHRFLEFLLPMAIRALDFEPDPTPTTSRTAISFLPFFFFEFTHRGTVLDCEHRTHTTSLTRPRSISLAYVNHVNNGRFPFLMTWILQQMLFFQVNKVIGDHVREEIKDEFWVEREEGDGVVNKVIGDHVREEIKDEFWVEREEGDGVVNKVIGDHVREEIKDEFWVEREEVEAKNKKLPRFITRS